MEKYLQLQPFLPGYGGHLGYQRLELGTNPTGAASTRWGRGSGVSLCPSKASARGCTLSKELFSSVDKLKT